tara:strand:+ start:65 stop:379 length:315 start_codon:yes stop_codon:yes gene_type:complete
MDNDVIMEDADQSKATKYDPPVAHYTEIKCNLNGELIKKLIGKNGYFFNIITKAAKVNYLWYDNQRQTIEIWGPMNRLADAKTRLSDRIERILIESQGDIKQCA